MPLGNEQMDDAGERLTFDQLARPGWGEVPKPEQRDNEKYRTPVNRHASILGRRHQMEDEGEESFRACQRQGASSDQ